MKNIYASHKKRALFFRKVMVKQILKRCILEMKRLLSDSVCRAVSEGCSSLGEWLLHFRVKKRPSIAPFQQLCILLLNRVRGGLKT